jgi:hypothetical protein
MKKFALLLFTLIIQFSFAQTETFNKLLQKHVTNSGKVNYEGLKKDVAQLDSYISYLSKTNYKSWSSKKQKAHLMNAYNAYTLKAVVDHYPIKSIKDINYNGKNVWEHPFVNLNGKKVTLTYLENTLIRAKFNDPLIHVGVNCAAVSCPKLNNKAFTEANVNSELNRLMKTFVSDRSRNKVSADKLELSKIFEWYKGDFIKNGNLAEFINKYSKTEIKANTEISFLYYNWKLNKQ